MADDVLCCGVGSITDLVMRPGIINLDFADIMTVMTKMGKAMMGTGEAEGENRAMDAALAAISNPLLDVTSMKGAKGVLINITGGSDMTLLEVDEAANRIKQEVDDEANIIFGSAFSEELTGKLRVTIIATGINSGNKTAAPVISEELFNQTPLAEEIANLDELPQDPRINSDELNSALIEEAKADLEKLNFETEASLKNSPLLSEKREPVSPPSRKFGSLWKRVTALTRTGMLAGDNPDKPELEATKELEYADGGESETPSDNDSFDIPSFLRRDQK